MKPLDDITVLDLGIITAGAATSAILADLGADVIKIESPTYRDPFRIWVSLKPEDQDKLSPHFGATNRGKRALALNLKEPDGQAVFHRLVSRSDVVVENFRRGVLDKLGIGFQQLLRSNPGIVLASISSQGETGPNAMQVSYGSTLECMAGMAWLLGYDADAPAVSGVDLNYPDQVAAIFSAGMIVSALSSVRDGGPGVHLDLSQRELTSYLIGDSFAEPEGKPARGNGDAAAALQDCFLAADGRWVAVTVAHGDVPKLEGIGTTTDDLEAWIGTHPAAGAAEALGTAGIPAAVTRTGTEVLAEARWSSAMREVSGGAILKGTPFNFGHPARSGDAPRFGEHTVEILERLGGYGREEIRDLAARGVVVVEEPAEAAE